MKKNPKEITPNCLEFWCSMLFSTIVFRIHFTECHDKTRNYFKNVDTGQKHGTHCHKGGQPGPEEQDTSWYLSAIYPSSHSLETSSTMHIARA